MERYKVHCSSIHKIMGRMGLTDNQFAKYNELVKRKYTAVAKPLTANMEDELSILHEFYINPTLPVTATTHLKEWYSGERDNVFSKYTEKGNYVEQDLIDFMAVQLGLGLAEKNQQTLWDDYIIGTCDVNISDMIVDVKAPWSNTTLQSNIGEIEPAYEWQGRGYMRLYDKPRFILFYGLMDTPAEVNYDREIIYSTMPDNMRWIGYEVKRDKDIEDQIIERVKLCREWLVKYDQFVKERIGKIHLI